MINPVKSRVLEKMRSGQKAISYKCNLSCPRAVEIAAMSGFDAVRICQEHVPCDQMTMETQILAAKAYGSDCIVRVAKGCYSDYIRPLEADATGIMIPHLMSYEEAKEIVHTVRFQSLGRRPVDGGNADGLFCKFEFFIDAVQCEAGVGESGEAIPVQPGPQWDVLWGRWEWRERKGKEDQFQHFHTSWLLHLLFPPSEMLCLLSHIILQESAQISAF